MHSELKRVVPGEQKDALLQVTKSFLAAVSNAEGGS